MKKASNGGGSGPSAEQVMREFRTKKTLKKGDLQKILRLNQ
jgi:hypothetical protein